MNTQLVDEKTLRRELNTLLTYMPDGCKLKNPLHLYFRRLNRNINWMTTAPFMFNENTKKNGIAFVDLLKYLRALVILENIKVILYYDVNAMKISQLEDDIIIKIPTSKLRNQFG
ncbi:unnamed protein product [Danaus chrysippus]|uniref:(African queen) hypothetical protein n=1 Tax=Danaus chrysippus TaxID=151541 RepID=A0A8J2QKD5_9NEOP|nr:unnamed protein product [Danaus chrysippus]